MSGTGPTGQLRELLEHVVEGEPSIAGEVDAVFRRADRLRRRRARLLLGSGVLAAGAVVAAGYLLTTTLLPGAPVAEPVPVVVSTPATVEPAPVASADPVRQVIEPLIEGRGLEITPRSPERGEGWRRYEVRDEDGPRGTVEVAAFDKPGDYCFPVKADDKACARVDKAGGLEFVRYDDDSDKDWQVRETIARRVSDGRTVAVMATGERDVGAERGKPGLTGAQVEQVATDERVLDAFGDEECGEGCPALRTPVD
ncbi:hypothetical protein Ade02nite_43310 [Paractinoplanes deccanensis]|uniref:Uncharacterized protein n=1 Tax=Paractinoplanes deccanensis TaxID=113561 RepID=A0ABQ3Y749_9ACTN|nr:hypothetical protein [Actinoplanes deccanensis]GID75690.1 hypothetical protein Ade02nite_43310 [Actinoplanes deccanensis]